MEELREKQARDLSLEICRKQAQTGEVKHTGKRNNCWYGYEKGVLVRFFQSPTIKFGDVFRQVIVPTELRTTVMQLAHDCIMSGHLAAKKTTEPILHNFYWLCIWKDVGHFCRPCDQCQRSAPKDKQEEYHCQQYRLLTSLSAVLQ